ncbi:MAG TPA: peptidoglycan DD-metalloendopeptidase family protein, partial [Bacillus sp. (in: firmicutes)]|nr:peptidoglycan DD-metalloendopeptidase family protein [Bacillus sp. (in: firmicutes)]
VASRWDDGLNDFQKQQVASYEFSWALLAGVDRMRNDPHYMVQTSLGIAVPLDVKVEGTKPPAQYLPIYQQAASRYNVDWEVLASIHFHESTYSTYPAGGTSTAGATGAMQFMPATWKSFGVDADGDGKADPFNTADAIFGAANYLNASGYSTNPRKALWHYNHATWYINNILTTAALIRNEMKDIVQTESSSGTGANEMEKENGKSTGTDSEPIYFGQMEKGSHMLVPRPEETFQALRPIFSWRESTVTTTWKEKKCTTNKDGNKSCRTVTKKKEDKVQLLTKAETYEGTYIHTYKWETVKSGDKTIKQEVNDTVIPPKEEDLRKPLLDYLAQFDITADLDIETTLELIAVYDRAFETNWNNRETLIVEDYPVVEDSKGWVWPTSSKRITSGFGPRAKPCKGCSTFHKGIDIGPNPPGKVGAPVYAIEDGTVIKSYFEGCGGNTIKIDHGDGIVSGYLHLSDRIVQKNDKVKKGQAIGTLGNSGSCTQAAHLHFQIEVNGRPVDPRPYFSGQKLK